MKDSTLLVVVGKTARPADFEPLSESARERNLHLLVLILSPMPPIPAYSYGIEAYGAYTLPEGWLSEVDQADGKLAKLRRDIAGYLADQGASAEVRLIGGELGAVLDSVARTALTCDMVLLGDDLHDDERLFGEIVRTVLFRSTAGVMLNALKSPAALNPSTAFLAWKTGLPSSRAARAALPLLHSAGEVVIGLVDPDTSRAHEGENPGAEAAAWLSHQGCKVTVQQYPGGGQEVGQILLTRASEVGADLIVMGAYDHSRLLEIVLGGTTRTLIEQRGQPVLLCH